MWNLQKLRSEYKIIAVLPAYNAEKTLERTINDIPQDWVDEIILVDDASLDGTAKKARSLGIEPIVHEKNLGYGANQKTCYTNALKRGADVVVMIHPDHQYDPVLVPEMVLPILRKECDAVFGSRMLWKGGARKGGMPLWKRIANVLLTRFENAILGYRLSEYHSGFRAYSRKALEAIQFTKNSDNFVFDTEIIVQLRINNFKIKETPIPTRYFKDASSISVRDSIVYGVSIVRVMSQYILQKMHFKEYDKFSRGKKIV